MRISILSPVKRALERTDSPKYSLAGLKFQLRGGRFESANSFGRENISIWFVFRLHQEINDFFKWMVPTPEEHEMRIGVVQRIEKCIQVGCGWWRWG